MTDRPILFSAPMVRAVLGRLKTQTRRIARPVNGLTIEKLRQEGDAETSGIVTHHRATREHIQDPKQQVGDTLWVREAHAFVGGEDPALIFYRANGYERECARHGLSLPYPDEKNVTWRPSIHMPRVASRISLRVTDVKVQRLRDISVSDAQAEGISSWPRDPQHPSWSWGSPHSGSSFHDDPISAFTALWNSLNEARGYGWNANPWVVATSFEIQGACDED